MTSDEIRLKDQDRHSACWATVVKYIDARMRELRARLEGNLSWEDTLQVRAQLRELKSFFDLTETPLPTGEEDEY